jgi:hypothetical protein
MNNLKLKISHFSWMFNLVLLEYSQWMSQIFMKNDSSKLILSTLTNEFLHAFYIGLVIFLFISFK